MANSWHVEWLREGATRWNKRRKRVDFSPDLSGIRFFDHLPRDFRNDPKTSRYFENFNFSRTNLEGSDLSDLNFARSNFTDAMLAGAKLAKSNFSDAMFIRSDLTGVDASKAVFIRAEFEEVEASGAYFEDAEVEDTIFISTELSQTQRIALKDQKYEVLAARTMPPRLSYAPAPQIDALAKPKDHDDRTKKTSYDVFFGTNREPVLERGALTGFGSDRSTEIRFGLCEVIVPDGHRIGKIGTSLFRRLFNKKEDALQIDSLIPLSSDLFWTHLLSTSEKMKEKARPTIFVHGFNNSFEDAVLRAAQIGHDLGIGQGIGLFSWPSRGGSLGYIHYSADEARAEASRYDLASFLEDFAENGSETGINIIAHSMGCRVLLGALEVMASRSSSALEEVHQIILAAADVDNSIMPHLSKHAIEHSERLTSYVSGKDKALELSGWLHSFPRVGKTPPTYVIDGMDTIIVNNMDLGDFAHAYLASSRLILNDVYHILKNNLPPAQRHSLEPILDESSIYWRIKE